MINTKSIQVKSKSMTITFQSYDYGDICNLDRYELSAIALLTGFYNPLRKHSRTDKPIDLDKLAKHKSDFNKLINNVISDIDVDVEDIDKLK